MNGRELPLGSGRPLPRVCETITGVPLAVYNNTDEKELLQLATHLRDFTIPIIVIDRVDELFDPSTNISESMTHVRPPFQKVWLEFSGLNKNEGCGALVEVVDAVTLQNQLKNTKVVLDPIFSTHRTQGKIDHILSRCFGEGDLGLRFHFYISIKSDKKNDYVTIGPVIEISHFIDKDGTLLSWNCFPIGYIPGPWLDRMEKLPLNEKRGIQEIAVLTCIRSLLAFSLMGCSNVSVKRVTDEYLDDTATPVEKKARQRVELPFHVLKITVGDKEVTIGGSNPIPRDLPLHHVRGHYRRYHIGPMIDGKVNPATERRFVLDFMRGNPEHGVSNKIYEVSSTT